MKRSLAVLLVLVALSACTGRDPGTVEMVDGQRFAPEVLEVDAGDTVTFTNEADDPHTVTAVEDRIPEGADYFASGGFDGEAAATADVADGLLTTGQRFEVELTVVGTYEYYCIPHRAQGMRGQIIVR